MEQNIRKTYGLASVVQTEEQDFGVLVQKACIGFVQNCIEVEKIGRDTPS